MSDDIAIRIENVGKTYPIFRNPQDRLKQMVLPRLQALAGLQPRKYYYPFEALHDISFEVRKGESLGIVGRNGSGKSTLLQIIAGTLQPTSGSVQVNGRVAALLELGSGFNPEFTGRENVYLNCSVFGLSREETDGRFAAIEDFADIGSFIDQPVKTYSSGMTMRLAFAVLTQLNADTLIVDEAFAVGDVFYVQKCTRFIRNFIQDKTFILVSHSTEAITSLCSRAIWLKHGTLMFDGGSKDCTERYICDTQGFEMRSGAAVRDADTTQKISRKHDMRRDLLGSSSHQNSIEIFEFGEHKEEYGTGEAEIVNVNLLHAKTKDPLLFMVGGEEVIVSIHTKFLSETRGFIIGFVVKDSRGQRLFGDNTFLTFQGDKASASPNDIVVAGFHFQIPYLPAGDYMIHASVARGTQDSFVHLHSLPNALPFKSHIAHFSDGLVGIPMIEISLNTNCKTTQSVPLETTDGSYLPT